MGHLLGAAPAGPGRTFDVIDNVRGALLVQEIASIEPMALASADVAAFAIDTPRPAERLPGRGIEINGWVIGRRQRAISVRALMADRARESIPLDVARPDVAADYPEHLWAGGSGFSFWAQIGPDSGDWRVTVEAVLEDGRTIALATIAGRSTEALTGAPPGRRSVSAPDFVIIGAQRGGTTSLHAYLSAHPLVTTAATKEVHFLTDRYERGRDWYIGQFPSVLPTDFITGEATPYGLFHPLAPARLLDAAPNAKLIALLRNPADRAYSHYLHERERGFERLSFDKALASERDRLAGEEEKLTIDPNHVSFAHKHFSYLARGNYARQIERWFQHFPIDQFLILRSEDLYQQPKATFTRVSDFLGLPNADVPFSVHNRTSGPEIEADARRLLVRHFAPLNDSLRELLGWDPDWT